MKPTAKFFSETQSVQVRDGGEPITLSMDAVEAIFMTLSNEAAGPKLDNPGGVHHPAGINAVPSDGALTILMDFQDGSTGQFVFPAPGKTHSQVAAASEVIRKGFQMLFETH